MTITTGLEPEHLDISAAPGGVQAGPAGTAATHALLARAVAQAMELAVAQHRAGQWDAADQLYQAVLSLVPDHPDAHHNRSALLHQSGQAQESLAGFRAALASQPENDTYWRSLFDALLDAQAIDDAIALLERRARAGVAVSVVDEQVARIVALRQAALPAAPGQPAAAGRVPGKLVRDIKDLFHREQLDAVVDRARRLTRRHPGDPFGWKALGAALVNLGRMSEALEPLARAVALAPDDVSALSNYGFALQNQRRPIEAQIHLELALRLKPDFASALVNMGAAMLSQNRYSEAGVFYRRGLAVEPGYVPAHSHLAHVDEEQGRLVQALAGYRRTLDLLSANPVHGTNVRMAETQAHAHQGVSSVQAKLADFGPVAAQSDAALALLPDDHGVWEKRLYALSYHPDLRADEIFAEFVRWGDRHPPPACDFAGHDRTPARRLKVAYVSPDFRRHTSRFYFYPFFSNHDHDVVELYAYSNVRMADSFTDEFKACFNHWRDIRDCSDDEVADMVRADGIDILVDACNHMRDERLGVFARKPAPIQVTWLGAAWTTGLQAVDYVLFDRHIAPPHTLAREQIVRLPGCFVPFQRLGASEAPQPPPCLHKGHITFAYSGRTERLNHHTFRVWGEILRRMPTARLVLDFRHFGEPDNQAHYRALMQAHGMDTDRVVMRNSSDILQALHDFDILLDCFPHSGGTMLLDALWMGVPALTLSGRPPLGRIGTTFLHHVGLSDWVAENEAQYIDKACTFAADMQGLASLRAGMRERMLASPLMDGKGFVRGVEQAYRIMWQRFCAGQAPSALDVAEMAEATP